MSLKLAFFDLEGTLIRKVSPPGPGEISPSAWTLIAQSLGPAALEEENQTKVHWNNGRYSSNLEWTEASLDIHRKYGLTKTHFESLMDAYLQLFPNVETTIENLRRRNIRTCIISGGFVYQANKTRDLLNIDEAIASCDYIWDKNGMVENWNIIDSDYENKAVLAKNIMQKYDCMPQECSFVGDGSNDKHIAREIPLSIAFNASPKLQEICAHKVNQPEGREDFMAVNDLLSRF